MKDQRILVVDDQEIIRKLFSKIFIKAGYEVTTANNAEEALEIMRKKAYWVLFLDLDMPPGMNGIELCKIIKNDWPMTICHAVTGYVSLFELATCREAGFEDYFPKPVEVVDLLDAAEHAFKKLKRWGRP